MGDVGSDREQEIDTGGWCAIVGGYVLRDRRPSRLRGRYLYGDVCRGEIWSARRATGRLVDRRPTGLPRLYLVSFGEDAHGRVDAVDFHRPVYRLVP